MMLCARYITILWPGLPWLWLRGSLGGLVLAVAFAVILDLAILSTWIWSGLFGLPFTIGVWTATVLVWVMATGSAVAAFPPALPRTEAARVGPLFVAARDAYLARDWTRAEARIRDLLAISPTNGEAQLLLATLWRRRGRLEEARAALDKLSASDAGTPWRAEIAAELARLTTRPAEVQSAITGEDPAVDRRRRAA